MNVNDQAGVAPTILRLHSRLDQGQLELTGRLEAPTLGIAGPGTGNGPCPAEQTCKTEQSPCPVHVTPSLKRLDAWVGRAASSANSPRLARGRRSVVRNLFGRYLPERGRPCRRNPNTERSTTPCTP